MLNFKKTLQLKSKCEGTFGVQRMLVYAQKR